jgi:hypothetical protein
LIGCATTGFGKGFEGSGGEERLRKAAANRYADRPFSNGSEGKSRPPTGRLSPLKKSTTRLFITTPLPKKHAD